jgi:hypothetical protein
MNGMHCDSRYLMHDIQGHSNSDSSNQSVLYASGDNASKERGW